MATFSTQWIANHIDKGNEPVDAASLAFFRIIFGGILLFSQLRFLWKGWVDTLYIRPAFYFKYFGFYWIHPLPGHWMYLPWIVMILSLVFIVLGKHYFVAITTFFFVFTYTELLDLTNYLNHYYLITLLSFIMIFLPMNASFSLDGRKWKQPATVPRWTVTVLCLQIGLVYFFAGLAKIKSDWLIHAEPLKIWLGTCQNIPIVGEWLAMPVTAILFSWLGVLLDLTAPFLLWNKKTRPYGYGVIVAFHLITLWLFYIGMFPLVMIGVTLIFFSPSLHRTLLEKFSFWLNTNRNGTSLPACPLSKHKKAFALFFGLYFFWQTTMPLRYLLYKGNVLWTEQGYRYSWNVMLIEKNGYVEFYIKDGTTGQRHIEYPKKYLTPLQEKMMSTQPDMILQYAHFLADLYRQQLHHPVAVYADSYVSLNQKPGQIFIDPKVDLSKEQDGFAPKSWIRPEN